MKSPYATILLISKLVGLETYTVAPFPGIAVYWSNWQWSPLFDAVVRGEPLNSG